MRAISRRLSRRRTPRRSASASPDVPTDENFNTGIDFNFRDTKTENKQKVIQLLNNEMNFTHLDAYNWRGKGIEQQRELTKSDKQTRLSDYYDNTINRLNGLTEYEKYMNDKHKRFLGVLTAYLYNKTTPDGHQLQGLINAYGRYESNRNESKIILHSR